MLAALLPAAISAGASLLGGSIANKNNAKMAEQSFQQNAALQKEFAQNAIQWKAADAEKAGISKLYAMGANTVSFSPSSVGTSDAMGPAIAQAGQGLGRALEANATQTGRASQLATQIAAAQLEGVNLDNDIKRQRILSDVSLNTQPGTGPGLVSTDTIPMLPGQGNARLKIQRQLTPAGDQPQRSYGTNPEIDFYRSKHGYVGEVPQELGEAQESQPLAAAQWFLRNKIMPSFSDAYKTYPYPAPEGKRWVFNPIFGEYRLVKGYMTPQEYVCSWREKGYYQTGR